MCKDEEDLFLKAENIKLSKKKKAMAATSVKDQPVILRFIEQPLPTGSSPSSVSCHTMPSRLTLVPG